MRLLFLLALAVQCLFAEARIIVQNAATEDTLRSLLPDLGGLPDIYIRLMGVSRIAPGSLVRVTYLSFSGNESGIDLSQSKITFRTVASGRRFEGKVLEAPEHSGRLIALVPRNTPLGRTDVILDVDKNTSATGQIEVVPMALGIYKKNGIADARDTRPNGSSSQNGLTTPAHPGDSVTLRGTGLGSAKQKDVSVYLAGRSVAVTYAGRAPGEEGVDHITFEVPDDPRIPDACYLELAIRVANQFAIALPLTKTATDICKHPLGFERKQMETLDAGGTAAVGFLQVRSNTEAASAAEMLFTPAPGYTRTESAEVSFDALDGTAIATRTGMTGATGPGAVLPIRSGDFSAGRAPAGTLDAGAALTLTSAGNAISMPRISSFGSLKYAVTLPEPSPVTDPSSLPNSVLRGIWRFTGQGGQDIGAFAVALPLPPAVRLKTVPSVIDTTTDQTFEWDPSGYTDDDQASLTLATALPSQSGPFLTVPTALGLGVAARTGRVVFSKQLLAHLVDQGASTPLMGTLSISVSRRSGNTRSFSVRLKQGGTAPVSSNYSSSETVTVQIR